MLAENVWEQHFRQEAKHVKLEMIIVLLSVGFWLQQQKSHQLNAYNFCWKATAFSMDFAIALLLLSKWIRFNYCYYGTVWCCLAIKNSGRLQSQKNFKLSMDIMCWCISLSDFNEVLFIFSFFYSCTNYVGITVGYRQKLCANRQYIVLIERKKRK